MFQRSSDLNFKVFRKLSNLSMQNGYRILWTALFCLGGGFAATSSAAVSLNAGTNCAPDLEVAPPRQLNLRVLAPLFEVAQRNPQDPSALAVLADAASEQGSSWGQYVSLRLQAEVAPDTAQREHLTREADALLARDHAGWFPQGGKKASYVFDARGLPRAAKVELGKLSEERAKRFGEELAVLSLMAVEFVIPEKTNVLPILWGLLSGNARFSVQKIALRWNGVASGFSNSSFKALDLLPQFENLTSLDLEGVSTWKKSRRFLGTFEFLPKVLKLEQLKLSLVEFSLQGGEWLALQEIARLPNLNALDLTGFNVVDDAFLSEQRNLRELRLSKCQILAWPQDLIQANPKLRVLSLRDSNIGYEEIQQMIRELRRARELQALEIHRPFSGWVAQQVVDFGPLVGLPHFQDLKLTHWLGEFDQGELAPLQVNPSLRIQTGLEPSSGERTGMVL